MKNFYQVLDIEPSANSEEIRKAFKTHAKHYHPDLHAGNEFFKEKFIEIKEAYDVLGNPVKREEYDKTFFGEFQSQSQDRTSERDENFRQGDSTQFQKAHESHDDEIQRILEWSWKKFENGDLDGAIEELEIGESKHQGVGYLNFAKGQAYQAYELYIPALREYKTAIDKKYYEAKDSIIDIEKIQNDTLEAIKPFLTKFPLLFSLAGIFLFLLIPDFGTGLLVGEAVNFIGAIVIIRIGVSKVSKSVLNSFVFNWDYNSSLMIGIIGAIVSLPIVAFFLFNS